MVLLELTRGKHQQRMIQMPKTDINSSSWNGLGFGRSFDSEILVNPNIVVGYIPGLLERSGRWSHRQPSHDKASMAKSPPRERVFWYRHSFRRSRGSRFYGISHYLDGR